MVERKLKVGDRVKWDSSGGQAEGKIGGVLSREHALSWDRRRLACSARFSRFALSAGETPAVPGRSTRKLGHDCKIVRVAKANGKIKGFEYKASANDPRYIVEIDEGKHAAHKAGELRKS